MVLAKLQSHEEEWEDACFSLMKSQEIFEKQGIKLELGMAFILEGELRCLHSNYLDGYIQLKRGLTYLLGLEDHPLWVRGNLWLGWLYLNLGFWEKGEKIFSSLFSLQKLQVFKNPSTPFSLSTFFEEWKQSEIETDWMTELWKTHKSLETLLLIDKILPLSFQPARHTPKYFLWKKKKSRRKMDIIEKAFLQRMHKTMEKIQDILSRHPFLDLEKVYYESTLSIKPKNPYPEDTWQAIQFDLDLGWLFLRQGNPRWALEFLVKGYESWEQSEEEGENQEEEMERLFFYLREGQSMLECQKRIQEEEEMEE
ncbi:MAG: hypothetical protein D6785_05210 [Planctomycetota bacterium]|nr:MAG: hypothetical protein D6785_05210 [Planctomycetota bacterium]